MPPLDARRRAILSLPAVALLVSMAGCARLLGPRTVEISREDLLQKLNQRFPMTHRVLNLLNVRVEPPRLDLLPETNRVAAGFDLTATELVGQQAYKAEVDLSFGLRFEPSDLTLRLTNVQVDRAGFAGLPPLYQRTLATLATGMLQDALQDFPVHRFKPEDLRAADRMGYEVGDILVTKTGLAVRLNPKP